jgi:hypothetical protein
VATAPDPGFRPADPDFERRTRASFERQGVMELLDALFPAEGGVQTLMTNVGRSGVKD